MKKIRKILSALITITFVVTSIFTTPNINIKAEENETNVNEVMMINLNALNDYSLKSANAPSTTSKAVTTTRNAQSTSPYTVTTTAKAPLNTAKTTQTAYDVFGIYDAYYSYKNTTTTTTTTTTKKITTTTTKKITTTTTSKIQLIQNPPI